MMELWEKSETVDPEVRAYVYSLVNAVGGCLSDDDSYQIGDDALAALHDIQRWLRLYDEKLNRYDVKRCLAEANLVKGDLIEILAAWPEEQYDGQVKAKLALACLQLLVPLTWPLEFEEEKTTANHARHAPYLQLAQVGYKRALLGSENAKILRTVLRTGLPSLSVERRERSRRDEGIIKLVLYLLRNVVSIVQPQHLPSQGDENEISRSSTIDALQDQDVFSLLLTIGSAADTEFQEQDVILLEILFHLLKGVDAKKLFMSSEEVTGEETNELQLLMQKEKAMHKTYNKHAPTRHNRFGTMIWVKRDDMKMSTVVGQHTIANDASTLQQMDASKKWDRPKYRGKLAQEMDETSDFGMRIDLADSARNHLRAFVEDFIDSSFNPLFSSLRKAIEREADRVLHVHTRQYFYLISWFLSAEQARRCQISAASQSTPEENTFACVAAVLDQETFVLLNRHMQRSLDEKSWSDIRCTLLAFTQVLLTVQSMADSTADEDQDIAENIQNRIFYEEATHDRLVQLLRGYTNQGFAYLDAVTECIHVFVRLLERYAKQNVDLQIRSKRRARKKRKAQRPTNSASVEVDVVAEDVEEEEEEEREAHLAVSERKFDFARFAGKIFGNQHCVDSFVALLQFYAELTPVQLKRCHRFLYRLAFKHENALLLFRVDVLLLLHRMIKGPRGLNPESQGFKDWEALVQQIFRRCIKWMGREMDREGWKGMCATEMLFSKMPGSMFYLRNGYERVLEKRAPRPPAELEFKGAVEENQRIAVAVSLMIEKGEASAVGWARKQLERAVEERQAWQDEAEARMATTATAAASNVDETASAQSQPSAPSAPSIFLIPDSDDRKTQLFNDKHLRLFLTSLGYQRLGAADDLDASWILPSDLPLDELIKAVEEVKKAEHDPPAFDEGKTAGDLVRSKASARRAAAFSDDESDDIGGGEIDDAMFPPNLRESRKEGDADRPKKRRRLTKRVAGEELIEAEAAYRAAERRRKEKEKNGRIKSQLFVTASDDESDEEKDAQFFRSEEQMRQKMAGVIRSAILKEAGGSGEQNENDRTKRIRGSAGKARKKRKMPGSEDDGGARFSEGADENDADSDASLAQHALAGSSRSNRGAISSTSLRSPAHDIEILSSTSENSDIENDEQGEESDPDEEEDTPSTSPTTAADKAVSPLKEVSANIVATRDVASDGEDDEPILKPGVRRRLRAGFVIESDSETE